MRNVAVMSGSGVLAQRVWLAAACFYFLVFLFTTSFKNNQLNRRKLLIINWAGVECD